MNLRIGRSLDRPGESAFHVKGHDSIINAIDGMGGALPGYGPAEIGTGGRDGRVCVWDPRQKDVPVAVRKRLVYILIHGFFFKKTLVTG